ncbi:MAG: aldehyde dehydrogenase family protein [Ilumatobacteraceae bacterium]
MTIHPNLIAGEWVTAADAIDDINPSDLSDVVGRFSRGTAADVDRAVDSARTAQRTWAAMPLDDRARILERIGNEIFERREELGTLLSREEGKTRVEGIGEAARAASIFRFFAGEVLRPEGQMVPSVRPGIDVMVQREALGVIGVITPWNFPIAIPAWKVAPALAHGNAVVWKPAEIVPATAHALADIIHRSGVPAGLLNLITGPGREVGQAIAEHEGIDGVTFTGSTAVGRGVAAATAARLCRVQLEMGGKNPLVVLDDADLERAVEIAIQGSFFSTGQRCTASSRLVITDGIHDRFVERLVERTEALVVGHALESTTQIGPVVSAAQLQQDLDYIAVGREEGARLVAGGSRCECSTEGYYLRPTVFAGATNTMRISREEIFGPVAAVIRVADLDEAIAVANDTPYGLTAGICTQSLAASTRFRREAQAGMVMVNLPTAGVDFHVPFGGRKASNLGPREQGAMAREFYTAVKTTYVAP